MSNTTKQIDNNKEVEELNKKFKALTIRHQQLVTRIKELEYTNNQQSVQIRDLQEHVSPTRRQKDHRQDNKDDTDRNRDSFHEGDIVQVTNNRNGKYGVVGKVYRVTRCQVHFTDIKSGGSISRAFHNVIKLRLSPEEQRNIE